MKEKTCRVCRCKFMPSQPMATVCGPACAISLAVSKRGKAEKIAKVKERRETKAKLEKLKTRADWLKEAKTAAQRFRRLEELANGSGCMTCKRTQEQVQGSDGWKPGGAWDGGHFLSKGARPELALEPMNIWLQCKSCNGGSSKYARKGHTVSTSFRINLIERIGLEAVEALEADNQPRKWTVEELIAIKTSYAAKARELKRMAA